MELLMDKDSIIPEVGSGNNLFPVFVKLEELRLLIVGGGKIGLEKLQTVLQNSPATQVTVVAPEIGQPVRDLADAHPGIRLLERPYHPNDLEYADIALGLKKVEPRKQRANPRSTHDLSKTDPY